MKDEAVYIASLRGIEVMTFLPLITTACGPEHEPRNFSTPNWAAHRKAPPIFDASAATAEMLPHVLHGLSREYLTTQCKDDAMEEQ